MNKVISLARRNLSSLIFLAIYLIMAVTFIFLESFQAESQLNILSIMLPCLLLGIILDFIVSRNSVLNEGQKLFTRILPSGIVLMYFIMMLFDIAGRPLSDTYNYVYYLFISGPFMIASYHKEGHKSRMISSLIGTAAVFAFYLNLTTRTEELDKGTGLIIFIVAYFMMFYSASAIRRLPFLSILLGLFNTAVLWYLYENPATEGDRVYSWDHEYLLNFEYVMLITFVVCILIRLLAEFLNKPVAESDVKASQKNRG